MELKDPSMEPTMARHKLVGPPPFANPYDSLYMPPSGTLTAVLMLVDLPTALKDAVFPAQLAMEQSQHGSVNRYGPWPAHATGRYAWVGY